MGADFVISLKDEGDIVDYVDLFGPGHGGVAEIIPLLKGHCAEVLSTCK